MHRGRSITPWRRKNSRWSSVRSDASIYTKVYMYEYIGMQNRRERLTDLVRDLRARERPLDLPSPLRKRRAHSGIHTSSLRVLQQVHYIRVCVYIYTPAVSTSGPTTIERGPHAKDTLESWRILGACEAALGLWVYAMQARLRAVADRICIGIRTEVQRAVCDGDFSRKFARSLWCAREQRLFLWRTRRAVMKQRYRRYFDSIINVVG